MWTCDPMHLPAKPFKDQLQRKNGSSSSRKMAWFQIQLLEANISFSVYRTCLMRQDEKKKKDLHRYKYCAIVPVSNYFVWLLQSKNSVREYNSIFFQSYWNNIFGKANRKY